MRLEEKKEKRKQITGQMKEEGDEGANKDVYKKMDVNINHNDIL